MPLTLSRSYLCGEQDICPECYNKPGADYPADAELQREGAPVVAQVAESISAKRVSESGGEEYRVRWKGCTWEEDSWEPAATLGELLVADFEAREARREARRYLDITPLLPSHHPF